MRLLVTGASGQLGSYVLDRLESTEHDVVAWSGSAQGKRGRFVIEPVELSDLRAVLTRLEAIQPHVILHLGAISAADAVRTNLEHAVRVNVKATSIIASWCGMKRRRMLFTSTDLVFDGSKEWNREEDQPRPILAYGRTKHAAELQVREASPSSLVIRVCLLYGPARGPRLGFFDRAIAALRRGEPQTFFEDEFRTPLDYPTAAEALVRLLQDDAHGVMHLGGAERMSRYDLMRRAAAALDLDPSLVRPNTIAEAQLPEPRPHDVSLVSYRLMALYPKLRRPTVEDAVRSMMS